jgi:DNA-binding NtrC family response regulator
MDQKAAVTKNCSSVLQCDSDEQFQAEALAPIVLVATVDPVIRSSMRDLLQMYPLRTLWARGVGEVRALLAKENVAACFCGFWLIDGTYRDVVGLLKRRPVEVPAIIVCEPACPNEYRDYLASLHIRAFDFICHPYRKTDLERILQATLSERAHAARLRGAMVDTVSVLETRAGLHQAGNQEHLNIRSNVAGQFGGTI